MALKKLLMLNRFQSILSTNIGKLSASGVHVRISPIYTQKILTQNVRYYSKIGKS